MKALFSILALLLINSAYAGTGEGGQIRFHNESSKTVTITFNGKGCNGLFARIYSVCEYVDVKPGQTAEYKYNGNVTST